MSNYIYGVLDKNNCHIDVSESEIGTKRIATREGYKTVSVRNWMTGSVAIVAVKRGNKWIGKDIPLNFDY